MANLIASEKHSLEVIRSLFGRSSRDVGELFESIGIYACLCCSKGEKIVLPYIGELEVEHAGEDVTARHCRKTWRG